MHFLKAAFRAHEGFGKVRINVIFTHFKHFRLMPIGNFTKYKRFTGFSGPPAPVTDSKKKHTSESFQLREEEAYKFKRHL